MLRVGLSYKRGEGKSEQDKENEQNRRWFVRGSETFYRFLNFHQNFRRFMLNFTNTPFQVLEACNIVHENCKSVVKFSISDYFLLYAYDKRQVISHWMTAPKTSRAAKHLKVALLCAVC